MLIFAGGPMHAFSDALRRALEADPRWVLAAVGFEVISFSGDAAAVDPAENLAGVKALMAEPVERGLDALAFHLGQVVQTRWCGHGISLVSQRLAELRW